MSNLNSFKSFHFMMVSKAIKIAIPIICIIIAIILIVVIVVVATDVDNVENIGMYYVH